MGGHVTSQLVEAMGFPLTQRVVAAVGPEGIADLVQVRRGG